MSVDVVATIAYFVAGGVVVVLMARRGWFSGRSRDDVETGVLAIVCGAFWPLLILVGVLAAIGKAVDR